MAFPEGFVYADLNVPFVRLSNLESAYQSGIVYPFPTPTETTIGDSFDTSSAALAVPLSGGRVATFYFKEVVDEPRNTVVYGNIAGWYAIECVITTGLTITSRLTIDMPPSPLEFESYRSFLVRGGVQPTSFNFAFNVAAASDKVVLGATIFDLTTTDYDPRSYMAQWLVLVDCSGTPTVVDEYLRDATAAPFVSFPPEGDVEIRVVPLDDQRVVVMMQNPDSVADPGEATIFAIKVSNNTLEFQNNGYPGTTGSYDFRYDYEVFLGYDQASNVGLYAFEPGGDSHTFGFSINASGSSISFGPDTGPWALDGLTYYPWGLAGDFAVSAEPGYFYAPLYSLPDTDTGNAIHTGKFRYNGGSVELVAVTPEWPGDDWSWSYAWGNSPGSGWRCVEYNGKVVVGLPAYYYDGVTFQYDLWLVNDAFGTPAFYRVANLSNAGGITSDSNYDFTLVPVGNVLYMAVNVVDAINSELLLADEPYGSPVAMTIVNFNQTDIDGELTEKERKFWRPRPGW